MKISVRHEDFDVNAETQEMRLKDSQIGAIVSFIGVVRADEHDHVNYQLELEHYAGMTEKAITDIALEAQKRFQLIDMTVIHRVGLLQQGEPIVLVLVAAPHRRAAFEGCEFIMDYLKTQAPFWKKEHGQQRKGWVSAKDEDDQALKRWGIESANASH